MMLRKLVIRIDFWSEYLLGQIYLYFYSKYSYDTLIIARSIEGDGPIVDVFTVHITLSPAGFLLLRSVNGFILYVKMGVGGI